VFRHHDLERLRALAPRVGRADSPSLAIVAAVSETPSGRLRVLLLFGGRSPEHAVSCISAGSVLAALDRSRYDVLPVGITRAGRWVLGEDDPAALAISAGMLPAVDDAAPPVALSADPSRPGLRSLTSGLPDPGQVDVVIPMLHGPYGEDGTIQGLLEIAGLPYVGSGVFASAAAMDKVFMKLLLAAGDLRVAPATIMTATGWSADRGTCLAGAQALGLPVFVKPARGGSSIGISRVSEWAKLPAAVELALEHDPKVLIEAGMVGREIECGVLATPGDGRPQASLPAEIRVTGGQEFYDFEAKYLDAATSFDVPADLPPEMAATVRDGAVRAFEALGCAGLARVDFFVAPDGTLVVNEVNTMPGFTPMSMFPRMWAATGVDYAALVDRLITLALERGTGLR
jgi:D-alanine-D-alanine ligase